MDWKSAKVGDELVFLDENGQFRLADKVTQIDGSKIRFEAGYAIPMHPASKLHSVHFHEEDLEGPWKPDRQNSEIARRILSWSAVEAHNNVQSIMDGLATLSQYFGDDAMRAQFQSVVFDVKANVDKLSALAGTIKDMPIQVPSEELISPQS